jgi:hypothetical protein
MKWTEVTKSWNEKHPNERLCRQRIVQIHDRSLRRIREALMNDPLIRDWAIDRGVDTDESPKTN